MDLIRGLIGDASWCFARVTDGGKPITRTSVRPGAEGLGPLAGDRIDAVYGFKDTPVVAHFATSRPADKEGRNRRFGLRIFGSKGVIEISTGWLPPAFLLADPSWSETPKGAHRVEITSAGPGKPEPLTDKGMGPANTLIVADLIHAVETDTQPKASVYDARASLEMLLACHASQVHGGPVAFPLVDRATHPLERLSEGS
jgi:predicted dehydrogenase